MNLQDKINKLKSFDATQTWYITRQDMTFWKLCYSVSVLKGYQKGNAPQNFADFHYSKITDIQNQKNLSLNTNHRTLNNAYYLGLIKKKGAQYEKADVTPVFEEITQRCSGNYENVASYQDILERQIEKVYCCMSFDEQCNGIRRMYRLFPIFALYKILLMIGDATGDFSVSMNEFFALVCTTEKYSDCFETAMHIITSRNAGVSVKQEVEQLAKKFSGNIRLQMLLKQLDTLVVLESKKDAAKDANKGIAIKTGCVDYVRERVYMFETTDLNNLNLEDFLCKVDGIKEKQSIDNTIERGNKMIMETIPANAVDTSVPKNLIIYGAPGTGKSYRLETEYRAKYFDHNYLFSRVTFNSNYTFADFVGVYKPTPIYVKSNNGEEYYDSNKVDKLAAQMKPIISYSFVPGPFLTMLCRALLDPAHNYLLLIEEINRANVSAVFGDIFQLLDRETTGEHEGCSEYGITLNKDAMDYIASMVPDSSYCFEKDSFVKIPSNLYLFATMNSADQNVNKMDTAFKRRWNFIYLGINETEEAVEDVYINLKGFGSKIKWNDFRKALNSYLEETVEVSEDKLIGPHFMGKIIEESDGTLSISEESIKYKLFMYLREDVLRHNPTELFESNWSFGRLIEAYDAGAKIFVDGFGRKLIG